jgi:translation elongation factor EF-G
MTSSFKFMLTCICLVSTGCAELELSPIAEDVKKVFRQNIVTDQEISSAFKQVLETATRKSIDLLASSQGFIKDQDVAINYPSEAAKLEQTLRKVGFGSLCDEFYESMNLAAEKAVAEATPLFIEAIRNITFMEASKILKGNETAITNFLKQKTFTSLVSKFRPVVTEQLEANKVTKNWDKMVQKYNKLPLVKPVQSDLSNHVTEKTIEGLFFYISKEEKLIRQNPSQRANELIQKVFSQVD